MNDLGPLRVGNRRWIAWKLVQLAHRICDTEYYERIVITDEHDQVGEFVIVGDAYGCGVTSYSGLPVRSSLDPDTWKFGSCDLVWEEFTPDWLDAS
jgi:hypothetical protein